MAKENLHCQVLHAEPPDRNMDWVLQVCADDGCSNTYAAFFRMNLNTSDIMPLTRYRQGTPRPTLLITPYVRRDRGTLLRENGIEYIDLAGNMNIALSGNKVFISGMPRKQVAAWAFADQLIVLR